MQKINRYQGVGEIAKTKEEEIEEEQLTNFIEAVDELYRALKGKNMLPESFITYLESCDLKQDVVVLKNIQPKARP